jgi:tetratricopeptide (TPR) repeat protein
MFRPLAGIVVLTSLASAVPVPPADNRDSAEALAQTVLAIEKAKGQTEDIVRVWCEVAALRHKLGDRNGASDALLKARLVADAEKRPYTQALLGRQIASWYAIFGDAKTVLKLAKAAPEQTPNKRDNPREMLLTGAAISAAHSGQAKLAEELAAALPTDATRVRVAEINRREAIIRRAKGGDVPGAIRAIGELSGAEERVYLLAGRQTDGFGFEDTLDRMDGIAPLQILAGDKVGANETARKALALLPEVTAGRRPNAALACVRLLLQLDDVPSAHKALAHARTENPKAAGKVVNGIPTELMATGYVVAAEIRAGREAATIALTKKFTRPEDQAHLLFVTAVAKARAGQLDTSATDFTRAVELAQKIPDDEARTRNTLLWYIANARAEVGDYEGAAKIAERAEDSMLMWSDIAHYQTVKGDFDRAWATIYTRLQDPNRPPSREVREVARMQAKAGGAEIVRARAAGEKNELLRAYILLGLAGGLFQEPRPAPAKP